MAGTTAQNSDIKFLAIHLLARVFNNNFWAIAWGGAHQHQYALNQYRRVTAMRQQTYFRVPAISPYILVNLENG